MAEILLEAIYDESVVLCDIVDDRVEAGKTGRDSLVLDIKLETFNT